MAIAARFPPSDVSAFDHAKIVGVRSGRDHRHTAVWVVVVDGRVFVRSWNDKATGWYRAFRRDPSGSVAIGAREVDVTGRIVRSARLRRLATDAYGLKYHTKASEKWVRGFAAPEREATTLELVPAARGGLPVRAHAAR